MYYHDKLFMRSLEGYLGGYLITNNKITILWEHKHFAETNPYIILHVTHMYTQLKTLCTSYVITLVNITMRNWKIALTFPGDGQLRTLPIFWKFQCHFSINCKILARIFSGRRQAIIWTNAGILLIGPLAINFSETLTEINLLSFGTSRDLPVKRLTA